MTNVTLKGEEAELHGSFLNKGNLAPDFILVNNDLRTVTLEDFKGKKKVIATIPSLDTPVCSKETVELSKLAIAHPHVAIMVISKDLPFAQSRFCGSEKIDNITLLSDIRHNSNFPKDYGVLIGSGPMEGLLARSVLVLDENDKVIYSELVEEITNDANLEEAFKHINDSLEES